MKTRTIILLTFLFLSPLTVGAQPAPPTQTQTPMSMQGQDQQRISLEWEHKAHMASRELLKFQLREAEKLNAKADIEAIQSEYAKAGERMAEIQKEYKRLMDAQKMREKAEQLEKAKKPEVSPTTVNPTIDTPPISKQPEGVH